MAAGETFLLKNLIKAIAIQKYIHHINVYHRALTSHDTRDRQSAQPIFQITSNPKAFAFHYMMVPLPQGIYLTQETHSCRRKSFYISSSIITLLLPSCCILQLSNAVL